MLKVVISSKTGQNKGQHILSK